MKTYIAELAALITFLGMIPYMIDTVRGKTKPNIVSWITWGILTGIGTAAAIAAHEPRTALLTLGDTAGVFVIVILGLRYGTAKLTRFDAACQIAAVIGLILWAIFNAPLIAIIASISIDLVVALPTIKHTWLDPQEETWQTFAAGAVASGMTLLSLSSYSPIALTYPVYLCVVQALFVGLVIWRRKALGYALARNS